METFEFYDVCFEHKENINNYFCIRVISDLCQREERSVDFMKKSSADFQTFLKGYNKINKDCKKRS